MTWEEYKTKRENKKTNNSTSSVISTKTETNTWDAYKKKREEERERRERERQMSANTTKTTNNANVLPKANNNSSDLEYLQREYDKLSLAEQAEIAKQINSKTGLEKLAESSNKINQPIYSEETLNKNSKPLKNHSNDLVAIGSNVWQGTKKGLMNFLEAGVSAMNNRWYDDDKLRKKMHEYGNDLREQAGKETVEFKSTEELYKDILGDSYNKNIFGKDVEREKEKWNRTKNIIDTQIALNTANTDSTVTKKISELAPNIGQQLPNYIPGIGPFYAVGSAKGAYMEDAKQRGMTGNNADTYSGIMGLAEGLTDYIGAGLTKSVGKSIIKGTSKEALKYFGLDIAENFIEEAVMEPISEATATLTGGKETANWDDMGKRMLNSGIDGALTSIIMAGGSAGIGKAIQVTNKINKGQQVTQQEISEAVKETLQSDKVNQEQLKETIKQNTNNIINQNTQTTQNNIDTNIENTQQTLYNNNESEVGLYGERGEIQGNQELLGQYDTRIQQESEQQESKKYTRAEFEKWEQSIKPIEYRNLTNEQKQVSDNIKRQYGKDIVFFDGNNSDYNGGASLSNSNKIYVKANEVNEFGLNRVALHEVLESNIAHNQDLKEDIVIPIIDAIQQDPNFQEQKNKFWENQEGTMPSDYAIAKDIICDRFSELESGEGLDYDNVLSQETNMTIDFAISNFQKQLKNNQYSQNQNVAPSVDNNVLPTAKKQTMNPTEISNLKLDDASTTPELPQRNYKTGNKQSRFLSNIITDSKFLNEDLRQQMGKEDNIRYYQGITNEKTLENAYNKLQKDGQSEVIKWHSKDSKNANAEDVAEGWILLKQYQDSGDYQSAVEVAKKMRDIGTTAGQTVQAYNILSRLTPEGMFYYAQSELNEAYTKMAEGKSKKWIEENQSKFDLTPEETQNILDIMKDVATMEDGYDKKVKIAEVQKIITNKIPPTAGQSIKAWMRISMLFNPKTQVRNVLGNAVIVPVNWFGDSVSAGIDKLIAKKTGVRTTGNLHWKKYGKGLVKGFYESYNDFKKGINTRNIEGNRFEVSEGKNFKDKGIGKAVNRVDNLLSFMLDAGDRGFYEATFVNSLNNQMVLNNVSTPTAEMIEIATNEALQRTWQDNNKYTQSVLKVRNIFNNVNVKGYGLGDVIIPFAKTPANLTKAIVDYSPAGLVKTLAIDARKLKNSLENGQFTAKTQHQFVQNLGKATAGTFLYVLCYALAKAGIATGEAEEDKDVKNFMKNSLGINSYSIKIGDKTFSYDWAQPIATPLAIMTNYVKYSEENPDANAIEKGIKAMNIGTEQLLQQSFMESLNTVLNGNGTTLENLSQAVLELPARAVPTFSKQITDMVDGTQRTSFEYDKPVQSAINSVVAKIPFASRSLPASVDTLGNEIQKYGGNNNVWNVMFNPANTNKGELSKAGQEIYNVYKETGDTTIFPRTAPYYINSKNEKVTMNAEQRSKFQTVTGKYVESALSSLLNDKDYKKLSNEEKANIINEIVSDSYSKAKYDVLKIDSKEYEKLRTTLKYVKPSTYYNYKFKTEDMKKDNEKIDVLIDSNYTNKEKTALYEKYILSSSNKKYDIVKSTFTNDSKLNINKYLQYKLAETNGEFDADRKDDGTIEGEAIRGSAKQKRKEYIENMGITYTQGIILYGLECTPSYDDKKQIVNYITTMPNKTYAEKLEMLKQFEWITVYKDGTVEY